MICFNLIVPTHFTFRCDNEEQLELYLEVTVEMDEQDRNAISTQISNSQTLYAQLKTLLFPRVSNVMEFEVLHNKHDTMATENGSVATVHRQNTTLDKSHPDPDGHMNDVDDESMNIQDIVDEGIDHVVQELQAMAQSQEAMPRAERMNIEGIAEKGIDHIVQEPQAESQSQECVQCEGTGTHDRV